LAAGKANRCLASLQIFVCENNFEKQSIVTTPFPLGFLTLKLL